MTTRSSERGSVIFFILIGVALLAALTMAVTSSLRLTGSTAEAVSDEKMRLALTEIQNVVESHRIAVTTMVTNGISVDALDGQASGSDGIYYPWTNTDCASDECKIYNPNGGGLSFYKFGKSYPDLTDIPGIVEGDPEKPVIIGWGFLENRGTTSADVMLSVRVNKAFCTFINKQIGVTADVDAPGNTTVLLVSPFEAGFRNGTVWIGYLTDAANAPHLANKTEGCYRRDVSDYRYFSLIYAL